MAKFAQVGYGSQGQGVGNNPDGYTYLVDDSVRTGDKIQVVATSSRGRKFGTTAVPLSTYKENSAKGQQARTNAIARGDTRIANMLDEAKDGGFITQQDLDRMTQTQITRAYTGKELGLERKGMTRLEYKQAVRGGNIKAYKNELSSVGEKPELTSKAQDTFDTYSSKFMSKGEQQ